MGFSLQDTFGINADVLIIVLLLAVIALAVFVAFLLAQYVKSRRAYEAFVQGKDAKSLEDTLIERLEKIDDVEAQVNEVVSTLSFEREHIDKAFQKAGLIKYNAFNEMGGKLSFSLCLLDRRNNGFIITAMHSREGCFTYIKEVIDGNSVLLLAEEEEQALSDALGS